MHLIRSIIPVLGGALAIDMFGAQIMSAIVVVSVGIRTCVAAVSISVYLNLESRGGRVIL